MASANWLWSAVGDRFDLTFGARRPLWRAGDRGRAHLHARVVLWRPHSRGRPVSARGFFRTSSPAGSVSNPSSIVDGMICVLNGLVLAGGTGYLAFGNVFCRDATLGASTPASARARPPLGPPGRCWRSRHCSSCSPTNSLIGRPLPLPPHSCAVGISQGAPFGGVMTTFTELRQHPVEILAFMNLIAIATGAVFGVMTYLFGPGVQPFTLLDGNILLVAFLVTTATCATATCGSRSEASPAISCRARRITDPPFRQSRTLGQESRLRAGGVGLGVRHAVDSGRRAREDPLRRRPDRGRVQHRAAQHPAALRAFWRACRARPSPSRAAAAPRGRARLARLSCGRLVERQ